MSVLIVVVVLWQRQRAVAACNEQYPLLNPLRRCAENLVKKREYEAFSDELKDWIDDRMDDGVLHVSVYFRDLDGGPWFGLNEDEEFTAASLLKVPVMIALLKEAEAHPELLAQSIAFTGTFDAPAFVDDPSQVLQPEKYYTLEELVEHMIIYSDNYSNRIIQARLQAMNPVHNPIITTIREIGILRTDEHVSSKLTVKQYSSFFRALYNASFLNREMSNRALDILSRVKYNHGISAGVPSGIVVAHKYGIRAHTEGLPENQQQLHDCGIVYHPHTPYLLCVMTRSKSIEINEQVIKEISRKVYNEVDARSRIEGTTAG